MQQILYRVKHKIIKEYKKKHRKAAPWQREVTFVEDGTHWYEPFLAGPSTFIHDCTSAETVSGVTEIISRLTADRFIEFNLEYYKAGLERFGANWKYADINTVLYGIAKNIRIRNYMEIGVRRGRSMSIVAALCPEAEIVGFDMWIPNYVGIDNPGPQFVRNELGKVGYKGNAQFVTGNSRLTVPEFFKNHPDQYFDLITVDGDHSPGGARRDLNNVVDRLKVGGFLVFDDICNPDHSYLKNVWNNFVTRGNRFDSYEFTELGYGVAFAIRKY